MSEVAEKPSELVQKADEFVLKLFKEKLPNTFLYHNYNHTLRVVKSTKEIIEHSEIHVKDKEALLLSAWLHDTGYVVKVDGHEEESARFAEEFLKENNADSELIEKVKKLILATKFDFETSDDLESILKDADASHFAKDYFEETSEFLRQELQLQGIANYTPTEWINENIKMFTEQHKFHTDYALKNWKEQKDQNLLDLLESKKKKAKKIRKEETKAQLKAKYKNESPERSIQTLYRVTLRNHIKLSDIADTKANILLSVNAIIISLALANIIPKLDSVTNRHLMIPTLILVLFSVASIILLVESSQKNK